MFIKKQLSLAITMGFVTTAVAHAEIRRDIVIEEIPANVSDRVQLELNVADGRDSVRIGDSIAFCFSANSPGYVSLWDVGTSGKVKKLFPYPNDATVRAVKPGERECVGNQRYKVVGPTGTENVVLLWTQRPEGQIEAAGFNDTKTFAERLARKTKDIVDVGVGNDAWEEWSTANVAFEIFDEHGQSDDGADTAIDINGIIQTNVNFNNVFVIAFGSNVGELKLTNDDARRFAQIAKASFDIPAANIRVVENAKRSDFEETFAWVSSKASENDLVLFYYSGHGTSIPDDNGDEHDGRDEAIVPYDLASSATWDDATKYIRDDQLKAWIEGIPAAAVVSSFDSCFSGGMYKNHSQLGLLNGRPKFFNAGKIAGKLPQYRGKAFNNKELRDVSILDNAPRGKTKYAMLAASQEAQYAIEVPGQGGIFTLGLYDTLKKNGNSSSWAEMLDPLSRNVMRMSGGRQEPYAADPDNLLKDLKF